MSRPTWNVLVLPSANEPGLEVVRSLVRSPRFRVFGASALTATEDASAGLLASRFELPMLGSDGFDEALRDAVDRHGIHFVFPTVDALVEALSGWAHPTARVIAPSSSVARLCSDKGATYDALRGVVEVPRVVEGGSEAKYPLFAKPARGSGSRDAFVVRDEADLALARARGLLVTEYLPGDEFTVDCCGDASGDLLTASVRRRVAIGRGIALASELVDAPDVEAATRAVAAQLRVAGPFFVQFRRRSDGTPVLLEVNARVGGSMGLTRLGGINIPQLALFAFAGYPVRAPRRLEGIRCVRSLQTRGELDGFGLVVWDLDDTLLRKDGKPDPELFAAVLDLRNRNIPQVVLTRNPDPVGALRGFGLERLFEAILPVSTKVPALRELVAARGLPLERVLMINDSWTERFEIEAALPGIVQLGPDAVDLLARERLE